MRGPDARLQGECEGFSEVGNSSLEKRGEGGTNGGRGMRKEKKAAAN